MKYKNINKSILKHYLRNIRLVGKPEYCFCVPDNIPMFHIYPFRLNHKIVDKFYIHNGIVYRKNFIHNILRSVAKMELKF